MGISESQLQTWSNPGPQTRAKQTHESVRRALAWETSPLKKWMDANDLEMYLQGSYKNDTNIRGDSDVDLVVQLNASFHRDISALSESEQIAYKQSFSNATYTWRNLKDDALKALQNFYGVANASEGRKCLKVKTPYLPCDVVVALQYRRYKRFRNLLDQSYDEGITFYVPSEDRWVVNYPKQHYDNGVAKNGRTNWFKPTVRLFKNARTYLVDRKKIADDLAPSYFLQGLLYNVPDGCFGVSYRDTFCNVVNWLHESDFSKFVCQNGLVWLFGNTPEQWSSENAKQFVDVMIALWNNWQ